MTRLDDKMTKSPKKPAKSPAKSPKKSPAKAKLIPLKGAALKAWEKARDRYLAKHPVTEDKEEPEEEVTAEPMDEAREEEGIDQSTMAEAGQPVDEAWLRNVIAVAQSNGRLAYRFMRDGWPADEMQEVISVSTEMEELARNEIQFMNGVPGTYSTLPRLARYVDDTIRLGPTWGEHLRPLIRVQEVEAEAETAKDAHTTLIEDLGWGLKDAEPEEDEVPEPEEGEVDEPEEGEVKRLVKCPRIKWAHLPKEVHNAAKALLTKRLNLLSQRCKRQKESYDNGPKKDAVDLYFAQARELEKAMMLVIIQHEVCEWDFASDALYDEASARVEAELTAEESAFIASFPQATSAVQSDEDWIDFESEASGEKANRAEFEAVKKAMAVNLKSQLLNLAPQDITGLQGPDGSGSDITDEDDETDDMWRPT